MRRERSVTTRSTTKIRTMRRIRKRMVVTTMMMRRRLAPQTIALAWQATTIM